MKNNREFLDEVFSEELGFQEGLIASTLQYGRRRRRRRHVVSAGVITASMFCLALMPLLFRDGQFAERQQPVVHSTAQETGRIPGTDIRVINDEELVNLFAGRPVGFVGEGNQRRFLVLDAFHSPR